MNTCIIIDSSFQDDYSVDNAYFVSKDILDKTPKLGKGKSVAKTISFSDLIKSFKNS